MDHREPDDRCFLTACCSRCGLPELVLTKGLCEICGRLGPVVQQERLVKQERLRAAIEAAGHVLYAYDRILDKGVCTRRRPDYVFDAGTHFVVVECDEHQHKRGDYAGCEANRMREIAIALGLPTVFIRYNPDAYKTEGGQRGRAAPAAREKTLLLWLKHSMEVPPTQETPYIQVLYLYYDGWHSSEAAKLEPLPLDTEPATVPAPPLTDDELTSLSVSLGLDM